MGWIISLVLLAISILTRDTSFLIPAGLFAIAGETGFSATALIKKLK